MIFTITRLPVLNLLAITLIVHYLQIPPVFADATSASYVQLLIMLLAAVMEPVIVPVAHVVPALDVM